MALEIDLKTAVIIVTQIVSITAFLTGLGVSVRYIIKAMKDLTGWIGRVEIESREGIKELDNKVDEIDKRTVAIETVCELKQKAKGLKPSPENG